MTRGYSPVDPAVQPDPPPRSDEADLERLRLLEQAYATAAQAMVPFAAEGSDDDDPELFEWHPCPQCPSKGGPCACSGMPWPSEAVRAAIDSVVMPPERLRLLEQVAQAAYDHAFDGQHRDPADPLRLAVVALRRHDAKTRKAAAKAGGQDGR